MRGASASHIALSEITSRVHVPPRSTTRCLRRTQMRRIDICRLWNWLVRRYSGNGMRRQPMGTSENHSM